MAREPGWYEDPEGLPGVYRWWDGTRWTVEVTTDPNAAPPDDAGMPPPAPVDPAGPAGEPSATDTEVAVAAERAKDGAGRDADRIRPAKPKRSAAWLIAIGVLSGLLVGAVSLIRPLLDLDLPDTDGIEIPDFPEIERGPGPDGRYAGGGLSYDAIQGRWSRTLLVAGVPMDDLDGEETVVGRSADGTPQFAYVWLGRVEPDLMVEGDLPATAKRLADRFATDLYPATARLTGHSLRRTRVDGVDAVRITRSYAYRVRGTPITGERLTVVVADTGRRPGVLMATVPDGYPQVRAQARRAIASLRAG